jgi:hypothetical protein
MSLTDLHVLPASFPAEQSPLDEAASELGAKRRTLLSIDPMERKDPDGKMTCKNHLI